MKKTILAASMAVILASSPLHATEAEGEYTPTRADAGLGIGALAGAIVGGPIGFVIGGLIGAHAGQGEDHKLQLAEKDQQLAKLRKEVAIAHAGTSIPRIEISRDNTQNFQPTSSANYKVASTLATGLRVDVMFRTNSQKLEPHYTPQLQRIIAVMKLFPEVDIKLAGHADPRGTENNNLALSERRINSIRQALVQAGIKNTRIHATAWGEHNTISTPSDIEAYAFDRRVVLNFVNRPVVNDKAALQEGSGKYMGSFMPAAFQHQ